MRSDLEDRQSPSLILWHLPDRYHLNQSCAFPVSLNDSLNVLNSIVWLMASTQQKLRATSKLRPVIFQITLIQCGLLQQRVD